MRALVPGLIVLLLCARSAAQRPPALDDVIQRLGAYLTEYANQLPATIATERYRQRVGSGVRYPLRQLESEYGILRVPGSAAWLGFREVLSVDGKLVTDSASRLGQILGKPSPQALVQATRDKMDQPTEGRAWVDPSTGQLFRAEAVLKAGLAAGNFISKIDVIFEHNPKIGFSVPSKMTEEYLNGRNLVTVASGEATYSNYRKFTVDTQDALVP